MREETAQETKFSSIFKDTWGRFSSLNIGFITWTIVLQLGLFIVTISCCVIGFVDPNKAPGIITSLCAGFSLIATPIWGIISYGKTKTTKMQNEKIKDEKEFENV